MEKNGVLFFPCLLLFTLLCSNCVYAAITAATPLSVGQTLSSPGGTYELGFFSPNNSQVQYVGIWFKSFDPRIVVWVANRDRPITDATANLTISSDGNLVLLDNKREVVWSTGNNTSASDKSRAELLDNGNLVLTDGVSGRLLWQSFEHLGDVMLPYSMTLSYDLTTGKKRVLTSWKSYTDPTPGDFIAEISPQVPSQVFINRDDSPYWRSGPWAKTRFTGIPDMDDTYRNPFSITQDVANSSGYLSFSLPSKSDLAYIILTSQGSLKLFWLENMSWVQDYEIPKSSCDLYGACGPFGLCINSIPSKCDCLKGFVPKSAEEWREGNWTRGCVRRTALSCQGNVSATVQSKGTDGFNRIANVKPPDSYVFVTFADEGQCHEVCLRNCSCTAFAYITGIGRLVWYRELVDTMRFSTGGEFLSVRLARSELGGGRNGVIKNERQQWRSFIATIVSLSILVILAFAAYGFWRCRKEHNIKTVANLNTSMVTPQDVWMKDLKQQDVSGLHFFEMHDILIATDSFGVSNKLGQGGFGPVYKGKMRDGEEVAVKRLSSSSGQGTEEFMNEIILISKLRHRNLVRLLGCCIEGDEKLLVYEFMANKSLDTFLFDSRKKLEIDWPKRFDIVQGVARGLLYLHRDSLLRVVHRDLKVSNILLDEKMNPKISDFGLARMFQGSHYQANTRRVVGTLGYMSPEYAWTGLFSEKSDIYSFGVLLLEIVSGKKISSFTYGEDGNSLLAYAWESWCETGGVDLLDQELASSCSPHEVSRCVQIGLLCVQQQAVDRPNSPQVLSMLSSDTDLPKPKKPIFALHVREDKTQSEILSSVNEETQTMIQGR